MTKKDFEMAAEIVRNAPRAVAGDIERAFIELFVRRSARFDEHLFRAACQAKRSER